MENETTPAYFIQVPLDMLSSYDLTPTDYLVFGQIYTMLNVTQKCFMSNANMGKKLGIKANTVQKSVSKMKKLGLIETNLIYKDGSKEVDKRFITLTPHDVYHHPRGRQSPTPRDENHGGGGRESTDNRLTNRLLNRSSSSGDDFVNEQPSSNHAFDEYQKLWGFPNAIALQDLTEWIDSYSDELVTYAIQIAGRNNVTSRGAYKYIDKVLTAWKNEKVTTVEQAKKQNEEHNNRIDREFKARKSYNKRPNIKETLPDWAKDDYKPKEYKQSNKYSRDELKKKIANLQNNRHDNSSNQNDGIKDYTREELEQRLNKFKEKRKNE